MKPSEILADARDELSVNYTRGTYMAADGTVCSISAIERVAMANMEFEAAAVAQQALLKKVRELFGKNADIEHAHDGISKDAMLEIWDKAIIQLEEVGS